MRPRIYRLKISPTVEAIQITYRNCVPASIWCKGIVLETMITSNPIQYQAIGVSVPTLGGLRSASVEQGDYIVKNDGLFTVMTKDEFERKYEIVP